MTPIEMEIATFQHIAPAQLRDESSLYALKWFDYRNIHPLAATYLFAEEYVSAVRQGVTMTQDFKKAQHMKILKHDDFLQCDSRIITGMWKARQCADALGMPYSVYCRYAIRYALDHRWTYMPKPCQMYAANDKGDSMLDYLATRWARSSVKEFYLAKSDFYKAKNYIGNVHQFEHRLYVISKIEKSNAAEHFLCEAVFESEVLSEADALKTFGPDCLRRAKKLSSK